MAPPRGGEIAKPERGIVAVDYNMSKPASLGQILNFLAVLANNIDWESFDGDTIQAFVDTPLETGTGFTVFLRRGGILEGAPGAIRMPDSPRFEASNTFVISVDYSRSLQKMIEAGKYGWTNQDITPERFPISGGGVVEFEAKVLSFQKYASSESVVEAIKKLGPENTWEPARIEQLLALGEKYPNMQREFPIVALGSACELRGERRMSYLGRDVAGRNLDLRWWNGSWNTCCRFLAVRKVSQPSAS